MKRTAERAERRKGFTLLELLVVVAIVAALIAIGVPKMRNYMTGVNITSMKTAAERGVAAERGYFSSYNEYVDFTADNTSGTKAKVFDVGGGFKITVPPGVKVEGKKEDCSDGSKGFTISASHKEVSDRYAQYDSCSDVASIQIVNSSSK